MTPWLNAERVQRTLDTHEIWDFPVFFPLNQSIDLSITMITITKIFLLQYYYCQNCHCNHHMTIVKIVIAIITVSVIAIGLSQY